MASADSDIEEASHIGTLHIGDEEAGIMEEGDKNVDDNLQLNPTNTASESFSDNEDEEAVAKCDNNFQDARDEIDSNVSDSDSDDEAYSAFLEFLKMPFAQTPAGIVENAIAGWVHNYENEKEEGVKKMPLDQATKTISSGKKLITRHSSVESSIFAARDGHTLEFDEIRLSTKSKNPDTKPPKHILKGFSGAFQPKTLTAVMGPSGSGKTSLLKILTGRMGGASKLSLSGKIRLDGETVDPSDINIRKQIAYVEQDVSIPPTATPREAITFSARLRLDKSMTNDSIDKLVNDILDNLGLQHCADTLIGGGPLMRGGLSGGEKKRVQCGVELVTNPRIVVLDEPTSGLDSHSALSLMDVLKKIANAGATVIVTIHQPPPPVVRKIDNMMLLLGGRLMYEGPMGMAVEHTFDERGFPKPEDYNIADWLLQVAQTNSEEELEKRGFFGDEQMIGNRRKSSSNALAISTKTESSVFAPTEHVGIPIQTRLLFDRELKKLTRDKLAFVIKVASNTIFGLLFGLIFLSVGRSDYIQYPEVMASFGAQSNLLISTMFGVAQSSLMEFPQDRPVFLREYSTNHYSIIPYFLAKFALECFSVLLQVLVQLLVAFFLMGFKMNFFAFLALNFMLAIASTSIGIFIGSCVENPAVAAEMMPALIVPQLLFSGFFIQISLIPKFLRWAQYLCSLTYATRLVTLYEFGNNCDTFACQSLLENNGVYQMHSSWYWIILFVIAAVFRVTSMLILKKKASF